MNTIPRCIPNAATALIAILAWLPATGCASNAEDEATSSGDEALKQTAALFTTVSAGDAGSTTFSAGSGAPYAGRGGAGPITADLGCVPTAAQLTAGTGAGLSMGWDGGPLGRGGLIQKSNYATLAAGGTLVAQIKVCDGDTSAGMPKASIWSEIEGNGADSLKITLRSPTNEITDGAGQVSACVSNPCSALAWNVDLSATGVWTVVVENTSSRSVSLGQFQTTVSVSR